MKSFDPGALLSAVPHWLIAIVIVAATALAALGIFRLFHMALLRLARDKPLLFRIFNRAESVLRYALVLFALAIVTPLLPLGAETVATVNRIMIAAFVVFLGWVAIIASDMAMERYIGGFRIDAADNLLARKAVTQMRILKRTAQTLIVIVTIGLALMTFETVRQFGVSIFASAGIAGLAVGLAAKPLLENIIAGIQIALTQPIRIDDAVIVEGEWGTVEELTSTYVVIRIWDWRRLIVPLSYFLQNPFQNWTRTTAALIGTVFFYLDPAAPVAAMRAKLEEIAKASPLWDGNVMALQVTDIKEQTIEVRALLSARNGGDAFALRCEAREKMLAFLSAEHPDAFPRRRNETVSPLPLMTGKARDAEEPAG